MTVPEKWRLSNVDEIARVTSGGTPSREMPNYWGGTIPWVTTAEVDFGEIHNVGQFITEEGLKNSSAKLFPVGTILMAMYGQGKTRGKVAKLGVEATTNQACAALMLKEGYEVDFYYQYLASRYEYIRDLANSGGQDNLSAGIVKAIPVPVPPQEEQRKIAKILSTWDEAIVTTEQLLANSEQQKKALMQQLLTGKKRLPGFGEPAPGGFGRQNLPKGWAYVSIGKIATEVSERNTEQVDLPVLSCSKYDGFVDSLKYFKKKVYSDDTSNYKVIHRGQFGFPANHVEEGSIGLQGQYDKGIVSPIYVVFSVDESKVDNFFLYKVLKTDHYRQVFAAATSASVDRRGSLRWKPFSSLQISLPSLEEQQAISRVIGSAEGEIELLESELKHLKKEKKSLMQQLLTGKRRVKVDKEQSDAVPA